MVSRRRSDADPSQKPVRPATTPEGRENQLIAAAVELAERRMKEGTASAQEIVHFLKLGSSRERLEQERLGHENELLQAKTAAMASARRTEELIGDALKAMRSYSGLPDLDEERYDD